MMRQLLSKLVFPSLETDLARTVGREVAKMDCNFAPQVYGYRPKVSSLGGAFGSTVSPRQQVVQSNDVLLKRVDIPFKANQGLFHE
mmetsp:Transcript_13605/g.29592  ORF Transcript_13605/g.29592 Transcript_13605/m.29592 type:complete len:86 (-) Transcript_13605:245-502(-)|eukprot:CAMPEP_0172297054 /NCGR_PEP_ID=MMETSP1058-20130122/223_1 /TAXON_ID=83371 /ORGANISM="Detonula confervacea, Strain CCMP 353" /LENGTH=85 /DNA_ID=CAMNT_0013006159 /DNA_START=162 /DNA_END=419 /DNA_ORIENTATION=-